MRQRRDSSSPFGQRLYFEASEFEQMMDDVRAPRGVPTSSRRVKASTSISSSFVGSALRPTTWSCRMGCSRRTVFDSSGRVQRVEIAPGPVRRSGARQACSEAPSHDARARGRGTSRVTPQLFFEDTATPSLFGQDAEPERTRRSSCAERQGIGSFRYSGEWWEYQANQCMASAAPPPASYSSRRPTERSPRSTARPLKKPFVANQGEDVLRALANSFDVSFEATWYRLASTGFVPRERGRTTSPSR